jgi:DNA primase
MSYHALHRHERDVQQYVSTAGAPSAHQLNILDRIFSRLALGCTVIAAVDADDAGDRFADQYARLASRHPDLQFRRDSPRKEKDWNEVLQRVGDRSLSEGSAAL